MPAIERRRPHRFSPRVIYQHLDRFVIGQERAKRTLAVAAYNHIRRVEAQAAGRGALLRKSNVLLIGPTGCGKTHMARHLAAALEVPFAVVDATEYTEAGYYGRDVEQMITELLIASDQNAEACSRGIIFIDEVDKIARRSHGAQTGAGARDIGGEGVQQSLLKLLEGREIFVPLSHSQALGRQEFATVDTSDILFICAGTFSDLRRDRDARGVGFTRGPGTDGAEGPRARSSRVSPRDLCDFGMIAEFLGRLPIVVEMEALSEDELLAILTDPPDSIVREYRERLRLDQIGLDFDEQALRHVVRHAVKRGLGARGLRSILEEIMADVMFSAPDQACDELYVDESFVIEELRKLG